MILFEISYQNAPSHTNTNDVMFEDARFEGFVVNEATVRWGDVASFSKWRGKSINLQNIFFIKNKKMKVRCYIMAIYEQVMLSRPSANVQKLHDSVRQITSDEQ